MLNHENYIQTIYISINKNFSLLDKTIKSCERLQEARKARWQSTPNPDIDTVETLTVPIFNAWRFEKDEHIIIPLFKTLLSELDNYDYIPIKMLWI